MATNVGDVFIYNATNSGAIGAYQNWISPTECKVKIECVGARGGYQPEFNYGGRPARMIGEFVLHGGDRLVMLVGQMGTVGNSDDGCGGGGGSFVSVVDNSSAYVMYDGTKVTPLIVAGGGGGDGADQAGMNASLTTSSTANGDGSRSATPPLSGGTANDGAGGGGFSGNGASNGTASIAGLSFLSGGTGGQGYRAGGFGGGGSGSTSTEGAGGGGGYAGAPGGSSGTDAGGGGGSYNVGANQTNSVATDITSNGYIKITIIQLLSYNLIKSNGTTYTFKNNRWKDLATTSPSDTDFINNTISDLNILITPTNIFNTDMILQGNLGSGYLYSKTIKKSDIGGISKLVCGSIGVKDFGTYKAWADGTYAKTASEYLLANGSSGYTYIGDIGSGVYRIQPETASTYIDVYCDMDITNDGGGWMLILNSGAKGSLTTMSTSSGILPILPSATVMAKLSDANINAIRGANLDRSIIKLTRPNNPTLKNTPIYFRQNTAFMSDAPRYSTAQDNTKTIYTYYTTYNDAINGTNKYGGTSTQYGSAICTWSGNSFPTTNPTYYYWIQNYSTEAAISNDSFVYEGNRSERCSMLWVKRF